MAYLAWLAFLSVAGEAPANSESRRLPGFTRAAEWATAESTLTEAPAPDGSPALHWRIEVDHTAGEAAYPIGWPRITLKQTGLLDWSGDDELVGRCYAETSRDALPANALNLGLATPDKSNLTNRPIAAVKGQWVEFRVVVDDLLDPSRVGRVQFNIAESMYRHGDRLDFYLADLRLLRYTRPTAREFRSLERWLDITAGYLAAEARLAGIAPGATAEGRVEVRRDGALLGETTVVLRRGRQRLILPLPGLAPGRLTVSLHTDAAEPPSAAIIDVIAGPFGEG